MRELLIATKNIGKYKEICEALNGLDLKFVFLRELSLDDSDFVEDGETFRENAYKKARYYFDKLRGDFGEDFLVLGEDSGIMVEALKGELGVKTRRFGLGEEACDEAWLEHFLGRMKDEENRQAEFVCCACVYGEMSRCEFFEGKTMGYITADIRAPLSPGIPLSSCFVPEGANRVYAALSVEEKNRISHRGKAMSGVREWLGTDL